MSRLATYLATLLLLAKSSEAIWPLLCGNACSGIVDAQVVHCDEMPEMGHHAMTPPSCQASSHPYLSTLAWCLRSRCVDAGDAKLESYWRHVQMVKGVTFPAFDSVVPSTAPPIMPPHLEVLNATYSIGDEKWNLQYNTLYTVGRTDEMHMTFGWILNLLVLVIFVIGGIQRLGSALLYRPFSPRSWRASKVMTRIKKHLILPALFNSSHQRAVLWGLGRLPIRIISLYLLIFFVLNFISMCVGYWFGWPSAWYPAYKIVVVNAVGDASGVQSMALFPIAVMLSGRNNPFLWVTGWGYDTFQVFHRWIGRLLTIYAVIHSIAYSIPYIWNHNAAGFRAEASKPYFYWGIISTVAFSLMCGLAALPIRSRAYETFIVLHAGLAGLGIIAAWKHIDLLYKNEFYYKTFVYVAFSIWAFDRLLRVIRLVFMSGKALLQGKKATFESLEGGNGKVIKISVATSRTHFLPGQYCYVYFPLLRLPWENHPFSIACISSDTHDGTGSDKQGDSKSLPSSISPASNEAFDTSHFTFIIRAHGGATSSVSSMLAKSNPFHSYALLEGPYGRPKPLHLYETVVLVAGGVGITAAMSYIQASSSSSSLSVTRKIMLVWVARELFFLRSVSRYIADNMPYGDLEIRLFCTRLEGKSEDGEIAVGRPDIPGLVVGEINRLVGGRIAFFISGPAGMMDDTRKAVVNAIGPDVQGDKVGYFEETYGY